MLAILTNVGFLFKLGVSKHPSLFPHNSFATSGLQQRTCLTKPQGVSEMYKSAAPLTDSVRQRNFDANVF